MNLTETEIKKKAIRYAHELLKHAEAYEPQITADLQKIASKVSVELVGLKHKFKSEESLAEKITQKSLNTHY